MRRATEDELADEFVRYAEAERWGALGEIGVNADLTDTTKKVMRAISRAHAQTGLPIFTHTHFGQWAIEQLDLYTSMGVPPQRLCIGHLADLAEDPAAPVQKAIARRGAYVGLDRVTSRTPEFDTKAISIAKALIDAGYVDHILVGSDGGAFENILKQKGGPGYARAYTMFIPKLRAAGVSDAIIRRITVDNPRRFLAFVPKKGK